MNKIIDSIKNNKLVNNTFFYITKFIDKVGKINFILLVFVICVITIVGLYTTLAADTSDNYSLIANTYKFIIGKDNGSEVIVAAGEGKYMDVTVSNPEKIDMKYALYYNSMDVNFEIGYLKDTMAPVSGTIKNNSEMVVSIYIKNNSINDVTVTLGVDYGTINGGEIQVSGKRIEEEIVPYSLFSDHIKNLYNDGSVLNVVNIGGDTTKPTVSLNANQEIMLDNNGEYRYYGTNPNNYVEFNDELWRIISVSNVKSNELDNEGNIRVKLIKNDVSGILKYGDTNDFKTSTLNIYMNDTYYNSLTEGARSMIDSSLYYLGGIDDYEGYYANDFYNSERGTNVYTGNSLISSNIIGLMYPSDYMYATDLSACKKDINDYSDYMCSNYNWMWNDELFLTDASTQFEWTITPFNFNNANVFNIFQDGGLIVSSVDTDLSFWRPIVYLKSNVFYQSGDGSEYSPYKLELS